MSLNFAPYSSPPSSPRASTSRLPVPSSTSSKAQRPRSPWFGVGSYQSGARPSDLSNPNAISSSTAQHTYPSGDVLWDAENGNAPIAGPSGSTGGSSGVGPDSYETTFGWRVDLEAAAAYAAGPLLAILLLILETKNDYV